MRGGLLTAVVAALLCAGCNSYGNNYRRTGNPPGQNPQGTPADRTGGARNVPDGAGGGPKKPSPADQK